MKFTGQSNNKAVWYHSLVHYVLWSHEVSVSLLTGSPKEFKMSRGRGDALSEQLYETNSHFTAISAQREEARLSSGDALEQHQNFCCKGMVAIGQATLTSSNKADIDLKYLLHLTLMHLLPPSPGKAKTTSAIKNS